MQPKGHGFPNGNFPQIAGTLLRRQPLHQEIRKAKSIKAANITNPFKILKGIQP
jgi:hypothetical protein